MVSDRVVYRSLLRAGLEMLDTLERSVRRGALRARSFQETVWKLVVRRQHLETDPRTACALLGEAASSYRRFKRDTEAALDDSKVRLALFSAFSRKVRQFGRDLRLAGDFDFFCAGGLDLRDEIELVRMYLERSLADSHKLARSLRELDYADARLDRRLAAFLKRKDDFADVGPNDGFGVSPGTVPRRFWWRYYDRKTAEQAHDDG